MHTEQEIEENLRDAGCDEEDIELILECYRKKDLINAEKLIEECRKRQLNWLHFSQQCIDRLDFLSYKIKQQI